MRKLKVERINGSDFKVCSDCHMAVKVRDPETGRFTHFNEHNAHCGAELNSAREV